MQKLKRLLVWGGTIAAVLLAIALLLNAWWNRTAATRLEQRLQALREKREPLTWDEMQRGAVRPEPNAAVPLQRARGELELLAAELDAIVVVGSKRALRLNAQQQQAVQTALDAHPAVLPLIEQAAQCPSYHPEFKVGADAPDLGPSTDMRNACRVLRYRLFLSLARGQRDGAMAAAVDQLRLASKLREASMLLPDYLIGLGQESLAVDSAAEILHTGPLSPRAHKELESILARGDDNASLCRALRGHRIFWQATIRSYGSAGGWLGRWIAVEQEIHYLDLMAQRIADAERSYPEVRAERIPASAPSVFSTHSVADSIRPTLDAAFDTRASVLAKARCLRILNAIVGRGFAGRSDVPSAAELDQPPETFVDPFTGRSLAIRRLTDGWLIYSAGADLQDDGGSPADGRDVGLAPESARRVPETTVQ
jgi:hypothetical protein